MAAESIKNQPTDTAHPTDLDDPKLYLSRELSLLEFQQRVMQEAEDETNFLLERVKFLSIVGSNMDEFFMVRVSGIKKQVESGVTLPPSEGATPAEQLAAIRKEALKIMERAQKCLSDSLIPELQKTGIHILDYSNLTDRQKENARSYFEEVIFPVVTPLAFDPGHPFPFISNLSLNLAVLIYDKSGKEHFARIKVPTTLPRLLPIKRSSGGARKDGTIPYHHYFVWLEQVIAANIQSLFPGMKAVETHPFRVTRDADLEIQELEASDLLESVEQSIRQRRFGSVSRLEINQDMPARIREILVDNMEMDQNDVYPLHGPLGLSNLMSLYSVERYDLKDSSFIPTIPTPLQNGSTGESLFDAIRCGDILFHLPYNSFVPVVNFLKTAAKDPDVLTIKQTLYRVGKNSPIVDALLEAAENGKQVAVLLELKARFDEESNIGLAKKLEKQGVHVIYGLLGLKTHSKIALVVRKEGEGIRRYIHLATGNYNAVTALTYEDLGMFTCDNDIGADATDLFNYLTGYSEKRDYRKLIVAPINLRARMEALIMREIEQQRKGGKGHLIFKMNALVDLPMVRLLYKASQAGVKVDLIVRGMCCLRPGLEGISDNIQVTSIVGRFLEHSRIYYFYNGGNEEVYLGSADLMPRNIDWRVEVLFPVQDPAMIQEIRDDILAVYMKDNMKGRKMLPDGNYERLKPQPGDVPLNSQAWFLQDQKHKQLMEG